MPLHLFFLFLYLQISSGFIAYMIQKQLFQSLLHWKGEVASSTSDEDLLSVGAGGEEGRSPSV